MKEKLLEESKRTFKPEFLNRLDDVIVFRSLTRLDLIQILDLEMDKLGERLKARSLRLQLDEKAKDFLIEKGYDPTYGARPMRRAVEQFVEDPLAEELLRGKLHPNEPVMVTRENDRLVFNQPSSSTDSKSSAANAVSS
jgi:ATP-dependent Clp protease ATP-binding subunit ClpC